MHFLILLFLICFLVFFCFKIKEGYKQKPENTWYIVHQNYCKKYCDKKYPVEPQINRKNRDQELVDIENHNKKIARRDYCFNTCQTNLYWNIIKIN